MVSIVAGVMCAFCYLFGVWVGRNKLKFNASQRIQSVKSVESVEADTPQTDVPRCSINGTPFDECGFCEHFNCDTCQCEADTPQTDCAWGEPNEADT